MALHLQGQGPKKKAATVSHHMQGVFRGGGGGRGLCWCRRRRRRSRRRGGSEPTCTKRWAHSLGVGRPHQSTGTCTGHKFFFVSEGSTQGLCRTASTADRAAERPPQRPHRSSKHLVGELELEDGQKTHQVRTLVVRRAVV